MPLWGGLRDYSTNKKARSTRAKVLAKLHCLASRSSLSHSCGMAQLASACLCRPRLLHSIAERGIDFLLCVLVCREAVALRLVGAPRRSAPQVDFSLYSSHAPRTIARNFTGFDFAVLPIEFSPKPRKRSQSFSERQPMLFAYCDGLIPELPRNALSA